MPLNAFPWVLNGLMEAWISLKRLQKFFDLHQLDLNKYYNLEISRSDTKIEVIGASFNLLDSNQEMSCRFNLGPIDFTLTNNLFIGVIGSYQLFI
jgi:ATP-binding cassette subfamily C (CFTR/MRP) protein 10